MPATHFISVKPRFAVPLIAGTKLTEVRKAFSGTSGDVLFVYASTPHRALIGHLRIESVHHLSVSELWETRGHRTLLAKDELEMYAKARTHLVAIDVEQPVRWGRPVSLTVLRERFRLEPPQSYRRINADLAAELRAIGAIHG